MPKGSEIGIKICGLQPADDVSFAAHPQVHYLGVIFVPRSRRFVVPNLARTIVEAAAHNASVIGVFANDTYDTIMETVAVTGIDGVQLHGDESPDLCDRIRSQGLTVWKAFSAPATRFELPTFATLLTSFASVVDAVLVDAPPPASAASGVSGGHGQTFDWTMLPELSGALNQCGGLPELWVAGGLQQTNVALLFEHFRPTGVDVSSGVEERGRKSREKINDFIEAVVGHGGAGAIS